MKRLLILLFWSMMISASAQDAVWSMMEVQAHQLNPALTGSFNGTFRVGLTHRSQWWNVLEDEAYHTQGLNAAYRFCGLNGDGYFGVGLRLFADEFGNAPYRTSQGKLAVSYMHLLDQGITDAYIALGAEVGLVQHSLDIERLSFNAQFINGGFDPDADTGETFLEDQYYFWDFSIGGVLHYDGLEVGFSAAHLLGEPRNAFISGATEGENKPPVRTTTYVNWRAFQVGDFLLANWETYHLWQRKFWMIQSGLTLNYNIYPDEDFGPAAGIGFRFTDRVNDLPDASGPGAQIESLIVRAGFNFGQLALMAAYDINLSRLKKDSKGFGALEIALQVVTPIGNNDCVRCPKNERQKKRARKRIH